MTDLYLSALLCILIGNVVALHFKIWHDRRRLRDMEGEIRVLDREILRLDMKIVTEGQLTRVIEAGDNN